MSYRTKVEVRTKGKVYKPGDILPADISPLDMEFLKSKKFVEVVDDADGAAEYDDDFDGDFNEMIPGEYKTAEEIRKIRKKADVYAYAASIGLDLDEDYEEKSLKELADMVINYQDEKEAEYGDVE